MSSLAHSILPPIALLAFASAHAAAQSFNIDVGQAAGPPAAIHGGAANQAGHWNEFEVDLPGSVPLVGLDGLPSQVSLAVNVDVPYFTVDHPLLSGDQAALLEDGVTLSGWTSWWFDGLQPGVYEVVTYAFTPEDATATGQVEVLGSGEAAALVGGTLGSPGYFAGLTHDLTRVHLAEGNALVVHARPQFTSPPSGLSGFQLTLTDEPVVGTRYCDSTIHSYGQPCEISATGSPDELTLWGQPVPDSSIGIFLYGAAGHQAPFGPGYLCVAPPIVRLSPIISGSNGIRLEGFDATATGLGTLYLQLWFRDPLAAGPYVFNTSDGLEISTGG